MRGIAEFMGFAGIALALHVAALQGLPDGSESAGAGGDAAVTVTPVSGSLAAMVAEWDRPPVALQMLPAALPQPSVTPSMPPVSRQPDAMQAPDLPALPDRAVVLPSQDRPPSQDVARSAPAPVKEAVPRIRPQPRPAATPAQPQPTATPAPQPSPRAQSQAAGRGAEAARGTNGPAETAQVGKAARQSLLAEWGGKIRNRIDRARPRGTGRGSVTVVLSVGRDGALRSVGIAASSGQAALDQRAVQAVRAAGRFPAAPAGLVDAAYSFRLPIRFD